MKYVTTGSTLLNLAITGKPDIGYPLGSFVQLFGEPKTGKSFLAVMCCVLSYRFFKQSNVNFVIIYNDTENTFYTDFVSKADRDYADSIMIDDLNFKENNSYLLHSLYVEDIKKHFDVISELDVDCGIYVLDSVDNLISVHDTQDASGFNLYKPKFFSLVLPYIKYVVQRKKILFLFISQVREKVGSVIRQLYTTGGWSYRHNIDVSIYLKRKNVLTKKAHGRDEVVRILAEAEIVKNRIDREGKKAEIIFDLRKCMIDDIFGIVRYLVEVGKLKYEKGFMYWKDKKYRIPDFVNSLNRDELGDDLVELYRLFLDTYREEEEKISRDVKLKTHLDIMNVLKG